MEEIPGWFVSSAAALFGSAVGSFANVVIHRVPSGDSIVRPPSACPGCGHTLSWWENIPVLSFILLRGRCSNCGMRISVRYPIVELIVAGLWVLMVQRFGVRPVLPMFLVLVSVLVMLSAIDLSHRRIPNKILLPASLLALALAVIAALSEGWGSLVRAGIGAAAFGLPMLGIGLVVPHGMGMGDIKLSAYLGFHLGWVSLPTVAVGAFAGFGLGALTGIGLMAMGRKGRKDALPFGPFLSAGTTLALVLGEPVIRLWLG